RLGTLEDAVTHTTSHGVQIYAADLNAGQGVIESVALTTLELYDCHIMSHTTNTQVYAYHSTMTCTIYDTTFVGPQLRVGANAVLYVDRFTQNSNNPGVGTGINSILAGTFNDLRIEENEYALFGVLGTIYNLVARGNTWLLYCWAAGHPDVFLVNPDVDVWHLRMLVGFTNRVYRQYEVDATVRDKVTGALLNGTATLYNNVGGIVFAVPIVAGVIATQVVSYGYYDTANGDTMQAYGPFHLVIEVPGYQTYHDWNLPVDAKVHLHIGMTR
ncbi:unnamed protein product, partial [marine sediment metagenome]